MKDTNPIGHIKGIPVYVDPDCEPDKVHLKYHGSVFIEEHFIIPSATLWDYLEFKKTLTEMITKNS